MGESKRRKEALGEQYGQQEKIVSWLPFTKKQAEDAYKITTKGAWVGIGILAGIWFTIWFVGPAFGWWVIQ